MSNLKKSNEILIVSAEASSELYARRIIEESKRRNLDVHFFGIGSQGMQKLGCEVIEYSENMAVVGLWEVLAHWKTISAAFRNLLKQASVKKPKLALLLDYPDFNLRLAKKLKSRNIDVYYYISPQIWAWRTERVKLIKKIIKKMLVVFPFEVDFYKKYGVDVSFVGHPLLDEVNSKKTAEQRNLKRFKFGITSNDFTVGLMPGSRDSEIRYCFQTQIRAAIKIIELKPELKNKIKFLILVAPTMDVEFLKTYLPGDLKINFLFIKETPFEMIELCDACIVASGTATLMTALMNVPMVIMYKMNPLTAALARRLVKGKFFGMPNLILNEKVLPELFQEEANPTFIANEVIKYIENNDYYLNVKSKLNLIKEKLGQSGAASRVVDEIQKAFL
ncbi:MAG: lipid-A-disaccharide synthase [Oligoflexia bacterium]|nr:lipid-A-disaccharide synthase [Oligoflexia bacterium]